jgi:hypothetical protein
MALKIANIQVDGVNRVLITVEAADRPAAISKEAREIAVRAATPVLGRCGFSSWGDLRLILPDGTVRKTDQELMLPCPAGTLVHQDLVVQGGL